MNPGQERMMVGEPTGQRLGQRRDLGAQPAFGQIGQCGGVVVPGDQRLQHGASRHAEDVGGDRRQLDPGVFEQLLQPLYLTGAFPGDRSARPSQITKLPDRLGWHERGPHQTVRAELGQPGRVGDIGLAAREVFHVPRIDQQHIEPRVLQQVVERLPVVAVASITAHVIRSAIRWSRSARIWLVIEPQVVTVSTVLRRPAPATRTHTLASLFEISSPAQRA